MRHLITFLILVLLPLISHAQKAPIKFGEVSVEDLKMTIYDKDSSASAVILVDYGEAYLTINSNTVSMTIDRHVRIKILKKEGLDWGDVSILLRQSGTTEERVSSLKASTYNLVNGKITESKLDKSGIFKEKFNRSFNQQKFTMPDVKEGSVLEYNYKIYSEFWTNFPNWEFQHTIPTKWSEYWAMIPDFFTYEKYMQGYLQVTNYEVKDKINSGYNVKAHHWVVTDAPAFEEEPYMTTADDYISKINFALSYVNLPGQPTQEIMGSWSKLNEELTGSEDFGKVIDKSGFLKETAASITAGITDPLKKIEAIHRYVVSTIEWDGTEDFYPGDLRKIVEKKKGTSGDINVLLAAILDKANIQVDMVLLSTRSHGFIRQNYPMSRQFNYVVCAARVEDKVLLLDATEKYLPYTILPERCLNGQGLVISKTHHGWINLEPKAKEKTIVNADLKLDNQGEIAATVTFTSEGYDAFNMRKEYYTKGEETYTKDFLNENGWTASKSEYQNLKQFDKTANQIHVITLPDHASMAGDAIYLNPIIANQIKQNPFKQDKRVYPIDYGVPTEEIYMCKIVIPDGFEVDEIPQSKVLALPQNGGRYLYNISRAGNIINLTSIFQINRSIFSQVDYPNLREFYNQIVAKQAEQIVLKKH